MTREDDTDIGIIDTPELGIWADRGDLVPVPAALRSGDHPFQWTALLPAYREHLIVWAGQAQALPLAGDAFVIVYRADRLADPRFIAAFRARFNRDPGVPTTWEEFADLALVFTSLDGKPCLPASSGSELADLFFRVAACYDRPVIADSAASPGTRSGLSFQFDTETAEPRLNNPSFATAADWLGKLAAAKAIAPLSKDTKPNPAAALSKGEASMAVLSLAQLAQLTRENGAVPGRFSLGALPGTRRVFDPESQKLVETVNPNYIPYFAGGRLGVVRSRCANPAAAFELLAELGGPTRSLEVLATPGLGAGPFRVSHLDRDRLLIWLGYGFDLDRSRFLQDAMRQYVRTDVQNRVYGLRAPDQKGLNDAAARELVLVATGAATAENGLHSLLAEWNRIDRETPRDTRIRWRKSGR